MLQNMNAVLTRLWGYFMQLQCLFNLIHVSMLYTVFLLPTFSISRHITFQAYGSSFALKTARSVLPDDANGID